MANTHTPETQETARDLFKKALFNLISDDDLRYEEECLRSPYTLKCWLRYIHHKTEDSPPSALNQALIFLYERALLQLPGSYKLWKSYLDIRIPNLLDPASENPETFLCVRKLPPAHPEWQRVNHIFERALEYCNKFPVIWLMYCKFLMHQANPTLVRRTFDAALKALPITQHSMIWEVYLVFAQSVGGDTAVRVWRRYIKLERDQLESYVDALLHINPPRYAEAARCLASIVENPKFTSSNGKTHFQLWSELCDLIIDHADEIETALADNVAGLVDAGSEERLGVVEKLDVEKILRGGISKFTDQVGKLWNALAKWWILKGEFEKARDIYEEAIQKVITVRDFSLVFDAYIEFEESLLTARMEALSKKEDDAESDDGLDDVDVDMRLVRFERLMDRRPFLVNDVILRQNPHNVQEWEKRAKLWFDRSQDQKAIDTYLLAFDTINPRKAVGQLHSLWIKFAEYYEKAGDLDAASSVYEKAVLVPFKKVDDLAEVWCSWAEMMIRHDAYDKALEIMGRATAPPRGKLAQILSIRYADDALTPQKRLFKSLKLWSFYVDLEEGVGTVESTKAVYDRIMELKIANAQIVCNYAAFLEEQKWFEESYKVYERGIELFGFPMAFDLWTLYLNKFVARYGGTKLERTRDLFENAVDKLPPKFAKSIYLSYAKLEEEHGLARHAMRIYDRATRAVSDADRYEMYNIYIAKATSFFGLTSTREIYEKAVENLPDKRARDMCLKFSEMELKLGEIDRARAIYAYASQFSDPRIDAVFWKVWQDFEVAHGNEDTFKEMLRIKRSVQAKFNTDVTLISAQILSSRQIPSLSTDAMNLAEAEIMEENNGQVVQETSKVGGFVRAKFTEKAAPVATSSVINPDEIEMGDESESEEEEEDAEMEEKEEADVKGKGKATVQRVEKREIPDGVFGSLAKEAEIIKEKDEEKKGAKDRFKKKM